MWSCVPFYYKCRQQMNAPFSTLDRLDQTVSSNDWYRSTTQKVTNLIRYGSKKISLFCFKALRFNMQPFQYIKANMLLNFPSKVCFCWRLQHDKAIEGHHLGICHQRYLKSCWDWHQLKSLTTGNISLPHMVGI